MFNRALSTLATRTIRASTSTSIAAVITSSSRYISYSSTLFSDTKSESSAETKLAADALTAGAQGLRKVDTGNGSSSAVSPKIAQLADVILTLNLMEAMQLSEVLKTRLGVTDTAMPFGAPMMMPQQTAAPTTAAAPPPAAAPAPAPAKEEKTHVDIKLKAFKAENKIKVIKEVRAVTNLGLKEAKDLVESAPCTLMAKVKKEDAAKIMEKLKAETGAELEIV